MSLTIRPLTKEDLDDLMPLIGDFWKYLDDLHEAQGKDFDKEKAKSILAATMDWRGHNIYGCYKEGLLVGFTDFWVLPDFFHGGNILNIQNFYVIPDLRGHGVGTAIMDRIIEIAKEEKVTDVHVEVLEENVNAQDFYIKMGLGEKMCLLQGQFKDA